MSTDNTRSERDPHTRSSGIFAAPHKGVAGPERTPPHSGVFPETKERRAAGPVGAAINFTDHGGPVIQNVHVQLIFWGTAWNTATPTMGAVTDAVVSILTGPYMNSLNQYRNISSGVLQGITLVTAAVGDAPANPPNPFSNSDIETLITGLCQNARVPEPTDSQLFYCVILPSGVNTSQGGVIGEHTFFNLFGNNAHYAWVMNNGTLNFVTTVFSHELVETVTDPEGSGITGDPGSCSQGGWCEIGDVCTGNTAVVNGIIVQRYWSQKDNACVVPTDKVVKDDKDTKDTKDSKDKEKDKEHKEGKDHKDHKDHKEIKDGAKEKHEGKEKGEAKEIDSPGDLVSMITQLSQRVDELGQHVDEIAQDLAKGKAFIRAEERPLVGEQAVQEPQEPQGPETSRARRPGKSS